MATAATNPIPMSNHQQKNSRALRRMQRNINCVTKTRNVLAQLALLDQNQHTTASALALEQASEEAEKYLTVRIEKLYGRQENVKRLDEYNASHQNHPTRAEVANAVISGSTKVKQEASKRKSNKIPTAEKKKLVENTVEEQKDKVEDEEITHKDRLLQSLERRRKVIAELNRIREPDNANVRNKSCRQMKRHSFGVVRAYPSRRNSSSKLSRPVAFQMDDVNVDNIPRWEIQHDHVEEYSHFAAEDEFVDRLEKKEAYRRYIENFEDNAQLQ